MNSKDIRITKPRIDCNFCELHHFIDFDTGKHVDAQYAVCRHRVKSYGCVSIDITVDGNPLLFEVSCRNCKFYESSFQLKLF